MRIRLSEIKIVGIFSILCAAVFISVFYAVPLTENARLRGYGLEHYNGSPDYNNTLYMLPILEVFRGVSDNSSEAEQQDLAEIQLIKDSLGPSGPYYKVGFSVSCWYSAELVFNGTDWVFDPSISLYYKLNMSVKAGVPVLFHMNGGNWGACGISNGLLKELWNNDSECQWDQFNRVPAPNYSQPCLKDRLFSLSKYTMFNKYREIHIKQAAAIIADFARKYPDLFAGCSLDSEIHLDGTKLDNGTVLYYDYNPLVIREYREWLENRYGDISEFNKIVGKEYGSFSTVDAPRNPDYSSPEWNIWTEFRHHLVREAVELQAKWLVEAGIPRYKIYSHQILSEPDSESARYIRCDTLETAKTDYCNIGITRYSYTSPGLYAEVGKEAGYNWGIFEWNIWHEHTEFDYTLYKMQLKAIYAAGVHIICPNGWFEFVNPPLMIKNNTYLIRAISDFGKAVGDSPRMTDLDGFPSIAEINVDFVMTVSEYLDNKIWLLIIPLIISFIGTAVVTHILRRRLTEK